MGKCINEGSRVSFSPTNIFPTPQYRKVAKDACLTVRQHQHEPHWPLLLGWSRCCHWIWCWHDGYGRCGARATSSGSCDRRKCPRESQIAIYLLFKSLKLIWLKKKTYSFRLVVNEESNFKERK